MRIRMQLYPHVLEHVQERRLAEQFWSDLLSPAADAYGWTSPWATTVPDDTRNLYSAIRADGSRAVTLDHMPSQDPPLDAWTDTFGGDGDDGIDFLRITTSGMVEHLPAICGMFEQWVGTDISRADMDSLLRRLERGDRSPLLGS
jgi:hypothetical protein